MVQTRSQRAHQLSHIFSQHTLPHHQHDEESYVFLIQSLFSRHSDCSPSYFDQSWDQHSCRSYESTSSKYDQSYPLYPCLCKLLDEKYYNAYQESSYNSYGYAFSRNDQFYSPSQYEQ